MDPRRRRRTPPRRTGAHYRLQQVNDIAAARYADMALRIFRNDAIQKYSSVFNQAARLAFLAAKAYAYETATRPIDSRSAPEYQFLSHIVAARTVGTMSDGKPLVGSGNGDGGLADVLARLRANWEILDGPPRLQQPSVSRNRTFLTASGALPHPFPVPKATKTGAALCRITSSPIFTTSPSSTASASPSTPRRSNPALSSPSPPISASARMCLDCPLPAATTRMTPPTSPPRSDLSASGLPTTAPAPIWLALPTVHAYTSSQPAWISCALTPDYRAANTTASDGSSIIRWNLDDQVIPIPYPIGDEQLNDPSWMPLIRAESGSLYDIRRYPSFRAYHDSGTPDDAEMISNARLIGRSVWNTRWLLIIPAGTLNNNRSLALDYFINGVNGDGNGVKDIKLLFKTYSYSGN